MKKPIFRVFISYEIKNKKRITRSVIKGTLDTFALTSSIKEIKEDEEFAKNVKDIQNIAKDFIKSKYYECVKDKVPSVVIHAAKTQLGWNETNKVDLTSKDDKIKININLGD